MVGLANKKLLAGLRDALHASGFARATVFGKYMHRPILGGIWTAETSHSADTARLA